MVVFTSGYLILVKRAPIRPLIEGELLVLLGVNVPKLMPKLPSRNRLWEQCTVCFWNQFEGNIFYKIVGTLLLEMCKVKFLCKRAAPTWIRTVERRTRSLFKTCRWLERVRT